VLFWTFKGAVCSIGASRRGVSRHITMRHATWTVAPLSWRQMLCYSTPGALFRQHTCIDVPSNACDVFIGVRGYFESGIVAGTKLAVGQGSLGAAEPVTQLTADDSAMQKL
jgi:hypothetical protein